MNKNDFKKLVIEEAKRILAQKNVQDSTKKEVENITPGHIKNLAEECKKITTSLDFRNPLINDEELIAEGSIEKPQTENTRWKRLIEYRVFEDESFDEKSSINPEDFFELVIKHKGLPSEMLAEGLMNKLSKVALPFVLAGYLSLFGGKVQAAVSQFEKDTNVKASTELVQKGIEAAKAKGVNIDGGDDNTDNVDVKDQNGISKLPLEGDSLKAELTKQPHGPGHDPKDVKEWKSGNTPSYKMGTPSEIEKTKAETEAQAALKSGNDLGGKITWISTPDGKTKIYIFHYDGNDKYYEIGRAPMSQDLPDFEPKGLEPDTTKPAHDMKPVDGGHEPAVKGQKVAFSMNVDIKNKKVPTGDGGYRIVKTGKPIGSSFIYKYSDGNAYIKDPSGNYWDISDKNSPVKIDMNNPDIVQTLNKMGLDTPPKILFKTWLDAKPELKDKIEF